MVKVDVSKMLEWRGHWEKLKREGYEPEGLQIRNKEEEKKA